VTVWAPFEAHVASAAKTLTISEGLPLDQAAADAHLAGLPTISAGGAVVEVPVRLAACRKGNHALIVLGATQVDAAGRIHGGENQELRFVCDGDPHTVVLHLYAGPQYPRQMGIPWHAGPEMFSAFGEVCALDFSTCDPVDYSFMRTVQRGPPDAAGALVSGPTPDCQGCPSRGRRQPRVGHGGVWVWPLRVASTSWEPNPGIRPGRTTWAPPYGVGAGNGSGSIHRIQERHHDASSPAFPTWA